MGTSFRRNGKSKPGWQKAPLGGPTYRSEQPVAAIDDLAIDQPRFGHKLMLLDWPGSINMENLVSVSHQPVGNQHAMAVKIISLGAHVSGARLLGQFDQFGNAATEFLCEHVIRVIAKAVVAQRQVGRVIADLLAPPTKLFEPDVPNPGSGQGPLH